MASQHCKLCMQALALVDNNSSPPKTVQATSLVLNFGLISLGKEAMGEHLRHHSQLLMVNS